jgi:hypothetical protein
MSDPIASVDRLPKAIRGIYVRSAAFRILGDLDPLDPGQPLIGENLILRQFLTDSQHGPGGPSGVMFLTTLKFVYRRQQTVGEQEAPPVAELEADIACDVGGLPDNFTQREREVFGATSVLNVCWPYWRELVQSSMTRMGLPATVLPPMNFSTLVERAIAAEQPAHD